MEYLVKNEATTIQLGPFLDAVDAVTPVTGLAGTMTVYVSKDGAAFGARASADAITHDRDGYYRVPLTSGDAGDVGRLKVQVTSILEHQTVWQDYQVVTRDEYEQITASSGSTYASVQEIRDFKIDGAAIPELSAYTDTEIGDDLNLASRMIESITNDWFYEKTVTEYYDGNGEYNLFFYPEIPARVIEVTSVEQVDVDGTTVLETYVEDTDFKVYDHFIGMPHIDTSRVRTYFGGGSKWPRGARNIKIVGTWGRAAGFTPPEIKRATILMTMERLIPGSTGLSPKDVAQAVWSDFTVTFRGQGTENIGMSTGYPEIDRLIEVHVNRVDMFLSVPDHATLHSSSRFRE